MRKLPLRQPVMGKLLVALTLTALPSATPASAQSFTTNGSGQYTGVTGLNVGGTSYDVTFVDGSCNALFSNCTTFDLDIDGAGLAADALLAAIESNADLNSNPQKTFGCSLSTSCTIFIPFEFFGSADAFSVTNWASSPDSDSPDIPPLGATDTTNDRFSVWARFAPAAVPEPGSWLMMLLGFFGIGASLRRRKAAALMQVA